ncbi:MAG: cupin domain-containing protein [Chloroflexi bacterium]|nr:cupin domain-containing protein [Chloroflexota bacterium]MYE47246.1 cupin domain-containing protein [Chloroflexota bacterium]
MSQIRIRSYEDLNPVAQFPGVTRRTLVSGDRLTFVEIQLEPNAEVPEHTHPHEQAGHVADGLVRFRIGAVESDLGPGSSYLIPGDVPHHVVALEESTLVEVFSPVREDFADD